MNKIYLVLAAFLSLLTSTNGADFVRFEKELVVISTESVNDELSELGEQDYQIDVVSLKNSLDTTAGECAYSVDNISEYRAKIKEVLGNRYSHLFSASKAMINNEESVEDGIVLGCHILRDARLSPFLKEKLVDPLYDSFKGEILVGLAYLGDMNVEMELIRMLVSTKPFHEICFLNETSSIHLTNQKDTQKDELKKGSEQLAKLIDDKMATYLGALRFLKSKYAFTYVSNGYSLPGLKSKWAAVKIMLETDMEQTESVIVELMKTIPAIDDDNKYQTNTAEFVSFLDFALNRYRSIYVSDQVLNMVQHVAMHKNTFVPSMKSIILLSKIYEGDMTKTDELFRSVNSKELKAFVAEYYK